MNPPDKQNKRAAALRATLELISEQVFHATPMSQIAQRAQIGVGTIYRHFPSKEALINALYVEIKTNLLRTYFEPFQASPSVPEDLKAILCQVVRYSLEHPTELLFVEQYENSPLITAATRDEVARLIAPFYELVLRAREENLLKELPFEMLVALIFGAIMALVKRALSGEVRLDEASTSVAIDAIWDMVAQRSNEK
ncbi:MAG: TetR/AcrR family transcriptional regulator [Bacteroidota bacterium]